MFEPIRGDLEKVEREFVRHLESQVALIPTIGHYIQQGGGKRNEPANVVYVAETIASLRGVDVTTIGEAARANFARLFQPGYD